MVRKSKGLRSGTRRKFKSAVRAKFKVTPYLQEFKANDRVILKFDPSSQKGMPDKRFKGKLGIVKSRRGEAYIIEIKDGKKSKEVISRPEHLVKE